KTDWRIYRVETTEQRTLRGGGNAGRLYVYDRNTAGNGDYGNVAEVWEYATWGGPLVRRTVRTFRPRDDATARIVDRPAREEVYDGAGALVRKTCFLYDRGYADPSVDETIQVGTRGLLTGVRRWLLRSGANAWGDRRFDPDQRGNRTKEKTFSGYGTDAAWAASGARETTTTYDATYGAFIYQVTNPLFLQETRTWDARWGKPTAITDANGRQTTIAYDTFGRLDHADGPAVGTYAKRLEVTYGDPAAADLVNRTKVEVRKRADAGGT